MKKEEVRNIQEDYPRGRVKEIDDADYTIGDHDDYDLFLFINLTANRTLTFPTLKNHFGKEFRVMNESGVYKVTCSSGDNINGSSSNVDVYGPFEWSKFRGSTSQWLGFNLAYDTGWINRSDWTNVHLGSDTTKNTDSNVTHNLDTYLSGLIIKILISSDGTENNSIHFDYQGANDGGIGIYQVDTNNILIQTGSVGIEYITAAGSSGVINTEDWYYKIKVLKP